MNGSAYHDFLRRKSQLGGDSGFAPVWMPDFLFDFQRVLVEWAVSKGRAAIFADCGLGKLNPVTEPVLTPSGWTEMGALRPGDHVIGSDGRATPILAVFPQGRLEIARVGFSDGSFSRCGWDHMWAVQSQNDRTRHHTVRVLSTRDIASAGLRYGHDRASRQWSVPLVAPVSYAASEGPLPFDAYALGVVLGDGNIAESGATTVTTDRTILAALRMIGLDVTEHPHPRTSWVAVGYLRGCQSVMRALGIAGQRAAEKRIPASYLLAHPSDRLSLLQGLMDTDGHALTVGGVEFASTSEGLCDDLIALARSLGGIARKRGPRVTHYTYKEERRDGLPSWRVNLKLPAGMIPFRLERKRAAYAVPTKYQPLRLIDSLESEGVAEQSVCIKVANPDGLYVTRDYIVTHNTPMQLVWAENVMRHTNKPVLIVTPLAVSFQVLREAEKFGVDCRRVIDGQMPTDARVVVTNYERLHLFDTSRFAGMVCDESSILKNFDGARRALISEFMRMLPYRLLCTATAAPNDYIELGTSSEALGTLGHMDMLSRFFKNDHNNSQTQRMHGKQTTWRFKYHAEQPFWRWVCSWARAVRKPSDLGCDDGRFVLPPLTEVKHVVRALSRPDGCLFDLPAVGLKEERDERRRTIPERCDTIASLVDHQEQALVWCHLNDEGDMLQRLIPDAQQVSGADSDDAKEEKLSAFADGTLRVLVTKPKIGAWGLNLQRCAHVTFFPSHSYEQYYQGVRRCWRFGQERPVRVDVVATSGEQRTLTNLQRKAAAADQMFASLVAHMGDALHIERLNDYNYPVEVPQWL